MFSKLKSVLIKFSSCNHWAVSLTSLFFSLTFLNSAGFLFGWDDENYMKLSVYDNTGDWLTQSHHVWVRRESHSLSNNSRCPIYLSAVDHWTAVFRAWPDMMQVKIPGKLPSACLWVCLYCLWVCGGVFCGCCLIYSDFKQCSLYCVSLCSQCSFD